ncbi:MAG: hypothetical protein IJU51_06135 [Clostridia bacterium]|nr:hypothetical protein [Clostridia bacterium]
MKKNTDKLKRLAAVIAASLLMSTAAACSSQDTSKGSSQSPAPESQAASDVQSQAESSGENSLPETESTGESSVSVSGTSGTDESSGTVSENVSVIEVSEDESSVTYGTENMSHPSDLVGKWSLKLDTTELSGSDLSDAEDRMKHTSILLRLDGSAVGDYGGATVDGAWGVQSGYVYIILGSATEAFTYYIDTLVSVNYPGMSFVK